MISPNMLGLLFLGTGIAGDIAYIDFPDLYTSTSVCDMRDSISVTLRTDNITISLTLRKNPEVDENVPVYVTRHNLNGTNHIVQATVLEIQGCFEYQDKEHQASIEVSCRMIEKDTPHYELNGGVITLPDGNLYTLEFSSRTKRSILPRLPGDVYELHFAETIDLGKEADGIEMSDDDELRQLNPNATNEIGALGSDPDQAYIDVVTLVDNSVYQRWYERSSLTSTTDRKTDTIQRIRRHFSHIVNGINMRFKTTTGAYAINIRMVAYIIEDDEPGTWFTEIQGKENPWHGKIINGYDLYFSIVDWLKSAKGLPQYDHIITWTAYDIYRVEDGVKQKGLLGLAYRGSICIVQDNTISLVEYQDRIIFDLLVAVHEVGHGLGARHDGDENECSSTGRYIMSDSYSSSHSLDHNNQYLFSTCSNVYFEDHIRKALFDGDANCITGTLSEVSVFNVDGELPGSIYDTDTQCRMAYGDLSYFCTDETVLSSICKRMYCWDTSSGQCLAINAAEGTPCGTDKACIAGECDAYVDPCQDDATYEAALGMSCTESVSSDRSQCYRGTFKEGCCATCRSMRTGIEGCEYGDMDPESCMDKSKCYQSYFNETCCAFCQSSKTGREGCEYGDKDPDICESKEGSSCCGYKTECCDTCEVSGSLCSSGKRVNPTDVILVVGVLLIHDL